MATITYDFDRILDRISALSDGLHPHEYFRAFDLYDELLGECASTICQAAERIGCVRIDYALKGETYYLHRPTTTSGCLKLTRWQDDGPLYSLDVTDDDLAVDLTYERGQIMVTLVA